MTSYIKRIGVSSDLNYEQISSSTQLILDTAREHGITYKEIPYTGLFKLNYQGNIQYLHAQPATSNTRTAIYCCKNKAITKTILSSHKISTPKGYVITKSDKVSYWKSIYKSLNKPLVVKPIDSSLAFNVYANINSEKEYLRSIRDIYHYFGKLNQDLLVEEMFIGTEYRVITTSKKILGVMARIPANVIGDGKHSINELVEIKNNHPWRGGKYALHKIHLDKESRSFLAKAGWDIESIPAKNIQVQLRQATTTNIDHGGDTVDLTNKIHPSVNKIILKAVASIPGLSWAGIDFFSKDITKKQTSNNYIILEINTSPNIMWQEFPAIGPRRKIAFEYLKEIYPLLSQVDIRLHSKFRTLHHPKPILPVHISPAPLTVFE